MYPAKIIIEKDRILTENANKTYQNRSILAAIRPYPKNTLHLSYWQVNDYGLTPLEFEGGRLMYMLMAFYAASLCKKIPAKC